MLRPQTSGTHIEIIAAAAFFRVSVYYTTGALTGNYCWELRKPPPIDGLRFPEVTNVPEGDSSNPISHFELAYSLNTHYDSIVSATMERPPQEPPQINTTVIDMTDVVVKCLKKLCTSLLIF